MVSLNSFRSRKLNWNKIGVDKICVGRDFWWREQGREVGTDGSVHGLFNSTQHQMKLVSSFYPLKHDSAVFLARKHRGARNRFHRNESFTPKDVIMLARIATPTILSFKMRADSYREGGRLSGWREIWREHLILIISLYKFSFSGPQGKPSITTSVTDPPLSRSSVCVRIPASVLRGRKCQVTAEAPPP